MEREPLPKTGYTKEQLDFLWETLPRMPLKFRHENDGCSWSFDRMLSWKGWKPRWIDLKWLACDQHDWAYKWLRDTPMTKASRAHYRLLADKVFFVQTYRALTRGGWPKRLAKWYAARRFYAVREFGRPFAQGPHCYRKEVV